MTIKEKTEKIFLKFVFITFALFLSVIVIEKLFHYSFEKFILSTLQRIDFDADRFSKRIVIIDTSPIYDLSIRRTDRLLLAELLQAVRLGQPDVVGLDIRLDADSLYQDRVGDSLLKKILINWHEVVVPGGIDPYFGITDSQRIANILIDDGYEIPIKIEGYLSLPLQMAVLLGYDFPHKQKSFIVNYQINYEKLLQTRQLIRADEILRIYRDESLSQAEKQDEIAMMLASQIVFIGFCNDMLDIDQHNTPIGKQAGIIIWTNAMHNLIQSSDKINYSPLWGLLFWALITAIILYYTHKIYTEQNFFYTLFFGIMILIQILLWLFLGSQVYFLSHTYLPIFSFIFVSIFAFPVYLQMKRLKNMLKVLFVLPKVRYLPDPLKRDYIEYLKEEHPFKKLHIAFTLLESCIRFSALLGLAQANSFGIYLGDIFSKQKWNKARFARLTLGDWQNIMRTLVEYLKNKNEISEQWKMIYLEKDEKNRWVKNDLRKRLDDNLEDLKKINEQESDLKHNVQFLESKPEWYTSFYNLLRLLNLLIQKVIISFQSEKNKSNIEDIQEKVGKVRHLIALRNRIVHDGGVFMEDEVIQNVKDKFEPWLKTFLFEKFLFWKEARLLIEQKGRKWKSCIKQHENKKYLVLKIDGKEYSLFPFFVREECKTHITEEFFHLNAIHEQRIVYFGKTPICRLEEEKVKEICDEIFKFLGINRKIGI